jgi:hypothetical protein
MEPAPNSRSVEDAAERVAQILGSHWSPKLPSIGNKELQANQLSSTIFLGTPLEEIALINDASVVKLDAEPSLRAFGVPSFTDSI